MGASAVEIEMRTIFLLASLAAGLSAHAQQTIFNVPSADITDPHTYYVEHESQFRSWQPGRYWAATDYFAAGIGHHTEIDVNLYNTSDPASGNISGALGFRSIIPLAAKSFKDQEFKWTLGGQALASLQGKGAGEWLYSHFSGRLPKIKTRLTAGISGGSAQLFGRNTVHAIAGIEHPLNNTVSLITDWYSGTHSMGYSTSGVNLNLPKKFGIYAGYSVPNNAKVGKQTITLEISKIF